MNHVDFIHLRVHSAYSLAEGAIRVVEEHGKEGFPPPRKDLITLTREAGMPAVALTDKNNMCGAMEFSSYAPAAGIQPIIGCDLSVLRPGQSSTIGPKAPPPDQLVLLVQNEEGYKNLSVLATAGYLATDRGQPCVTWEELAAHTNGLIALGAGIDGPVGRLLLEGQDAAARERQEELLRLFPNRFYIEISRHRGGEVGAKEARIEPALLELAYSLGAPLVATNDVYFGDESMAAAHEALLCISDKTVLADEKRRRLTPDHRFKTAGEMRALFADLPEALANSVEIARRCAFMPPKRKPILPPFQTESGLAEADELRLQAEEGLKKRLIAEGISDPEKVKIYEERLAYEMDVIVKMGFPGYFLIVSDFIKWSKSHGVSVGPGRGSGAGSVVAWALLITDLDPLRFGLLFERFLNPERVSMPDFDVDFCQERREKAIEYVQTKYGADHVAQIITFGKLQARAALRDVGRVLGMPYGYVDKICKLVPSNPANPIGLAEAIASESALQELRDSDPTVAQLMDIALKLEGLYRNASTHAAGVVIGDRPLVELVPLYRDPASLLPATQFNMKTVESTGLVKFDFLGLKTLDVLQQAVELIEAGGGACDLENIPLDDPKTFQLLSRGDTTGVFQLESSGMRDVLRKMKPNRFEDIIALVALYRPGPMDNIPTYIKCKNGEETVHYLHERLEPILKDTFGILIYQEQVMQSAQILAGYSLGGADLLRRAMGKKKVEEMAAQRQTFIDGAGQKGIEPAQASLIFDQIDKFAGYGFNKSHAAAYALIAYRTAWLKANYQVEFLAAAMNFEKTDTDKLNVFRQELARHNVPLLPPDANKSDALFQPETLAGGKKGIRYALSAIKGVGEAAMISLCAARKAGGPFKDLFDLAERVDARVINRKQLEGLASAGAFDAMNRNRAQVVASLELLLRHSHAVADEKASGQANIFGALDDTIVRPKLEKAKPWDDLTRLQHEFQSIGFYLSAHPLDNYKALLARLNVVPAAQVASRMNAMGSSRFKLAGVILAKQERTAKSGNRFAFLQASDTSGAYEVTIFSDLLSASRDMLEPGHTVLIDVDAQAPQNQGEGARYIARHFDLLSDVAAKVAQGVRIHLYEPGPLPEIKALLAAASKGRAHVVLELDLDDDLAEIELEGSWFLDDKLKANLRSLGSGLEVEEY